MRSAKCVAALYDIHGNLPALEAVLDDVRAADVDLIVVGGDVIPGPMPLETLDRVMSLDVATLFVRGNGEREVLAAASGDPLATVPPAFRESMRWVASQLDGRMRDKLSAWPLTARIDIEAMGPTLFCHATPASDADIFSRASPPQRIMRLLGDTTERLTVCGHTHMQFDITLHGRRVVNAGSVGMPFDEPGAYWLLLGPGVELRRTEYDLEAAAARIRRSADPYAGSFADRNVLSPMSSTDALAMFSKADQA